MYFIKIIMFSILFIFLFFIEFELYIQNLKKREIEKFFRYTKYVEII